MSNKVKIGLSVALFGAALVVYVMYLDPFKPAPGAGKEMVATCGECKFPEPMMMDEAIKRGAQFSGETGWTLPCVKCGKPASILPVNMGSAAK